MGDISASSNTLLHTLLSKDTKIKKVAMRLISDHVNDLAILKACLPIVADKRNILDKFQNLMDHGVNPYFTWFNGKTLAESQMEDYKPSAGLNELREIELKLAKFLDAAELPDGFDQEREIALYFHKGATLLLERILARTDFDVDKLHEACRRSLMRNSFRDLTNESDIENVKTCIKLLAEKNIEVLKMLKEKSIYFFLGEKLQSFVTSYEESKLLDDVANSGKKKRSKKI